ncbi:MAG: hypothetical protein JW768_02705, partial [Chitinispirillaceae bacterium]|nr:hypothetical protein [Chitinispirillaceae bacterium]
AASTGSFVLYEDETPKKTTLSFSYAPANQMTTVNIGAFAGSKYCPQAKRIWRVEVHCVPEVRNVQVADTELEKITAAQYNSGQAGWLWDGENGGVCYIGTDGATGADVASGFPVYAAQGPVGVLPHFAKTVNRKISITHHAGILRVAVPFRGNHRVEILNAQGRVIASRTANTSASHSIAIRRTTPSLYFIRVNSSERTVVDKLML